MTRPYLERRNLKVFVLVDRRKVPPKDVPDHMAKLGFVLTYANVRKILSAFRKIHNNSHKFTPIPLK